MKCSVCGREQTRSGTVSVTLELSGGQLEIRNVPAEVCPACGEEHVEDRVAVRLLKLAEDAGRSGAPAGVRDYAVA
jgi:YgiT-type zinc finger domain-containing protein